MTPAGFDSRPTYTPILTQPSLNAAADGLALDGSNSVQKATVSLPEPLTNSAGDLDLLGMVLELSEAMGRLSAQTSESRIQINQGSLREAMHEFQEQMAEALRKAEAAAKKHHHSGFFGFVDDLVKGVCDFVAKVVGKVVGPIADFVVDLITQPIDIIVGLIKGQNFEAIMRKELDDMTHNGSVAKTVSDCAKGIFNFVHDLVSFGNTLIGALEAGIQGKDAGAFMKESCENVLDSAKRNILNNPAVMKVVGIALAALSVVTLGAAALVAVGLMLLCELNEKLGLMTKCFGKEAGGWVNLGLRLVCAVVSLVITGNAKDVSGLATRLMQVGTAVQATSAATTAYENYKVLNQKADDTDRQANLQQVLNRMQHLQSLTEDLISVLQEGTKAWDRDRRIGSELVELKAAGDQAVLMPA